MSRVPCSVEDDGGAQTEGPEPPEFIVTTPAFEFPVGRHERRPDQLARMVESQIIPRLLLAHRQSPGVRPGDAGGEAPPLGADGADAFARMALAKEPESLIAYVGGLLQAGVTLESVYMDLMAPAARRLGEFWDDDSVSFTEVTIGLGRLQQVVRRLGWKPPVAGDRHRMIRSAIFATTPGEQHTFGLFIIEDAFRREGWHTWMESAVDAETVAGAVRGHWFDLLGVSMSRDDQIDRVEQMIAVARKASQNPGLFIMVGGRLVIDHPEIVARVGADGTAANGADALLLAGDAVRRLEAP